MAAIRGAGVDVPDEQGRQVAEFVPGPLALDAGPLTYDELRRVGAMVRRVHDASETYSPAGDARWTTAIPAPGAELSCHDGLAP
ncbi:hypothetical protein [Arthrobacter sp. B0490]|uniref:hypothetical protein n=1 Tax=Arthrobacter sp. B0490 TaxID=2058891 RepID=UPI000CE414CC|nr:hypothetical protein [Arthrobacter sp. B0490]